MKKNRTKVAVAWLVFGALVVSAQPSAQAQSSCENCVPHVELPSVYYSLAPYWGVGLWDSADGVADAVFTRFQQTYGGCSEVSRTGLTAFSQPTRWAFRIVPAATPPQFYGRDSWATFQIIKGPGCGIGAETPTFGVARIERATCPPGYSFSVPLGGAPVCVGPPRPKVVVIDPGHGLSCPSQGMPAGAVGATDFPATDPPAGRLREDELTVAIALEIERTMSTGNIKVLLTKRDVSSCPSYLDRGRVANNANAKVLVSLHINAPNPILNNFPFGNGTSALYHPNKSTSKSLADRLAADVSLNLGVNNRGAFANTELAVLKPTVTTAPAVLLEVARLSGNDEKILHSPNAKSRTAVGVKSALNHFLATQP